MESGAPPGGPAADDESRLWSYATQGWVSAAPTVADGVVYVGSNDHRVYALDAATGNELWSYDTGEVVVSVPTVADGVIYVGSNDNHLHALDADTGGKLWELRHRLLGAVLARRQRRQGLFGCPSQWQQSGRRPGHNVGRRGLDRPGATRL